jgi:hypothetical protein
MMSNEFRDIPAGCTNAIIHLPAVYPDENAKFHGRSESNFRLENG